MQAEDPLAGQFDLRRAGAKLEERPLAEAPVHGALRFPEPVRAASVAWAETGWMRWFLLGRGSLFPIPPPIQFVELFCGGIV